ncbi:MAG: ankyrin repeat domain-containing protein [Verrucomicrobiales bacterium]|nr:ankyrin repeat domain-containing protein [Verrucomicrobiales bacterium]
MKTPVFSAIFTIGTLMLALIATSCSDPQKQARKALEEKGYGTSVNDLIMAAGAGDTESLDLFVQTGMDIDSKDRVGNTALIKAAGGGHARAVERILGMGADPRHRNSVGRDALMTSSAKGFEQVSRMLLSRGGDITIKDSEGWSSLSIAAFNGHADVVSLLSSQASPTALDDALLVASFNGDEEVISRLLGAGANINARSPASMTPLMIAAEGGKAGAVRTLLQNQANPYSETNEGQTAAMLAGNKGFTEVQDLIMEPGQWGSSPESEEVLREMAEAQKALLAGAAVEETLVEDALSEDDLTPVESHDAEVGERMSVAEKANASTTRDMTQSRTSRVREEAKSKPIAALNGSTIHSRSIEAAPVKSMILAAYHEEPIPLSVSKVDGDTAEIRRLDQKSEPIEVEVGTTIPGTPFEVKEVTRKFVSSKEGKGRMVDVSRVKVENTHSGATHLLVNDISGQSADAYAILTSPDSKYRYVVKSGDVFRTSQPNTGTKDYQVLDIRASGVVVKDLATEDVLTIARDGIVAPR